MIKNLVLLLAVLLAACGGGGENATDGSSSSTWSSSPVPAASRAVLDEDVVLTRLIAGTFAANRNAFVFSMTGLRDVGALFASPCTSSTPGLYGGDAVFSFARDAAGNVVGEGNYFGFNGCLGIGLHGFAIASGVMPSYSLSSLNLAFNDFLIGRWPKSYRFTGTATIHWSPIGYAVLLTGAISDDITGRLLFSLTNFLVDAETNVGGIAGVDELSVSGVITDISLGLIASVSTSGRIFSDHGPSAFYSGQYQITTSGSSSPVVYDNGMPTYP
ncbi:MAG: hypothetical protein JWL63_2579 [Rhodocyclales bacterium]|nr:hypothetical protein [Rhodocyclales bacterium]